MKKSAAARGFDSSFYLHPFTFILLPSSGSPYPRRIEENVHEFARIFTNGKKIQFLIRVDSCDSWTSLSLELKAKTQAAAKGLLSPKGRIW